jgi:hypothetical protein
MDQGVWMQSRCGRAIDQLGSDYPRRIDARGLRLICHARRRDVH